MKNKYSSEQILKMAVDLIAKDSAADLNSDGLITAADARLADIAEKSYSEDSGVLQKPKAYTNPYGAVSETVLNELSNLSLSNGDENSNSFNSEKIYNRYKDMYTQNAENEAEHIYGLAAGNTGGYGNSYAASAASAAYNDYIKGLDEKLIDISELEAKQINSSKDYLFKLLDSVSELADSDYSRYRDTVSDYYKDEDLSSNAQQSSIAFAFEAADRGDYTYIEKLGIDSSKLRSDSDYSEAVKKAEYGDYSGLKALGINTDMLVYSRLLDIAVTLAGQGDYSALKILGVDVDRLKADDLLQKALSMAKQGDTTLLGTFKSNYSRILNSGK